MTTEQQKFDQLVSKIERNIKQVAQGSSRAELHNEIDFALYEAKSLQETLESNARHGSYHERKQAQEVVNQMRRTLNSAKRDYERAKKNALTAQDTTRISNRGVDRDIQKRQRQALLDQRATLTSSGQSLDRAIGILDETNTVGQDVNSSLVRQREQLQNAQSHVDELDTVSGQSARLLRSMRRKVMTNKMISCLIITLEISVIVLVVWLKCYRH